MCVTDGCFDFNVIALFPNALESDRLFRVHGETDEAEDDGAKMRKQKIKIKRRQKGDWLEFQAQVSSRCQCAAFYVS